MQKYAGCWRRNWAFIIDGWLIVAAANVNEKIFLSLFHTYNIPDKATEQVAASFMLIALFFYFVLMESSHKQATIGKMILGIRVTDIDGNRISINKSFKRTLSKSLSFILLFGGFIMICFTKKRQALHDILAGCLVARVRV